MVHLSVAIGTFFEALFYAILRVAGLASLVVIGMAFAGFALFMVARLALGRRTPR